MADSNHEFDLVVIGSGPAGQKGAIAAAKSGKKVAIIERRLATIGGVSLHQGTIPSKTIREAILHLTGYRQRHVFELAYAAKNKIKMNELKKKLLQVTANELRIIRDQLQRNNVEIFEGDAAFVDPNTVSIENGQGTVELSAKNILVATGSKPVRPSFVPFDGKQIFDSNEILELKQIPQSMIVIGGGVVGIEYGLMFAILGTKVTIVDRREDLLTFCDREIVECLMFTARSLGVVFRLGESVQNILSPASGQVLVEVESKKRMCAETVLFSGGRESEIESLALDKAGVKIGPRGKIECDEHFQTNVENIYAVGDVIGYPALSSTSMEQGRRAVLAMYGKAMPMPRHLPYGLYTIPEISMIGYTEKELTAKCIPYEVGLSQFDEICRGQISGCEIGFLKILFCPNSKKLLGVHCIGESATELIHVAQAVMHFGGTIDYFANNVFNYPTMAECYKNAALDGLNRVNAGTPLAISSHLDTAALATAENVL